MEFQPKQYHYQITNITKGETRVINVNTQQELREQMAMLYNVIEWESTDSYKTYNFSHGYDSLVYFTRQKGLKKGV